MSSDRDTFIAALNALYGFDQAQQQAANIWLNDFAKNPAAWQVGLDMLTPASPTEPMFFCANMLLDKVRREWGKLSQDQRSHLTQSLG